MELHVLNHPLVEHKLTVLRDKNTPSSTFRELVSELVMLEAYEATRNLSVVAAPIETPVAPMTGVFCQIFVGRFGVSFSPFERLFLGRFGFGQSCGLSVIA